MADETNDQSYFPTCKVRLIGRFDEFGQKSRLKPAPKPAPKDIKGVAKTPPNLTVVSDPVHPGRFLLVPKGQPVAQPAKPGAVTDDMTFELVAIPKSADWNQNGIRTADTFHATFRYVDCPIDPRLVRACSVEYFLGTITPEEYAMGVQGFRTGDQPMNLVPDTYQTNAGTRSNSRFKGWVDKWSTDWSENSEPMITIECRDNTQLLIDEECPPNATLQVGMKNEKPLDEAIANYLANFINFAGLSVVYYPVGQKPPKLAGAFSATYSAGLNLGPVPAKGGGAGKKLSVWDYLTDVCGAVGHIIRMDGDVIIVQSARSFTTNAIVRRPDDPYRERNIDGMDMPYRRFIFGKNLKEMRISRNYSKSAPKNIQVNSWNNEKKSLIQARFPEKEDRAKWILPGHSAPDEKWTVIRVENLVDPAHAKVVAQSYYESMGRNEIQIELKTDNLASFGGGNLDPDILDAKTGDTFDLHINREEDESSSMTWVEKQLASQSKAREFLLALGYNDAFATAYAKAYNDASFLTSFRFKSMNIKWDSDSGVTISVQGVNYIEVRADVDQAPGTSATGEPGKSAPAKPLTLVVPNFIPPIPPLPVVRIPVLPGAPPFPPLPIPAFPAIPVIGYTNLDGSIKYINPLKPPI